MNSRLITSVGLFAVLFGLYALIFQGHYLSIDELYIYDSAESFIHRGSLVINQTFNVQAFTTLPIQAINSHGQPWLSTNHEPLMPVVVAPLVGLAQRLPDIGNMTLVWFFNLFVTGITSVSLYLIGMYHGISPRVAWVGALLFGIGTIAAFYGRLLFREPLTGLFILWAFAIAAESDRRGFIQRSHMILLLAFLLAAFLTKTVALLLLPNLLLLLLPLLLRMKWRRIWLVLMIAAGGAGILILLETDVLGSRYTLDPYIARLRRSDLEFALESVLGYQISPSRSLWLYSPILLMCFPGSWYLWKAGYWRVVVSMFLGIVTFSFAYGVSHAHDWMGGWGWGPRYLLPLIPILMLFLVFPTMERMARSRRGVITMIIVSIAGVIVQIIGFAVPLSNYYTDVFRAGQYYDYDNFVVSDLHWMGLNWKPGWSPLAYHVERWDFPNLDIAWRVAENPAVPVAVALALSLMGLTAIYPGIWNTARRGLIYVMLVMSLILVCMTTAVLSLRNDPRVIDEWPDVHELVEVLNTLTDGEDVILLDRALYTDIFMNYQKSAATLVTLPYATAEFITDKNANAPIQQQLGAGTVAALNWLPGHYYSVWLVASSSPYEPNMLRPVERYLAFRYFPAEEISISPRARAIRYLPYVPPSGEPEMPVNAVFDGRLELVGFDLPGGNLVDRWAGLPVSLVWQVLEPLGFDYNVGVLLLDSGGVVRAEHNGPPQGTFGKMTAWQTHAIYRDNHGLVHLQPGEYQMVLVVYNWQTGERLKLADGTDLLILGSISVQ